MGLDQYAYVVKPNPLNTDFSCEEFDEDGDEASKLLAEWRKHPNLEGWMEKLFNDKANAQGFVGKTELNSNITVTPIGEIDKADDSVVSQSVSMEEMKKKIEDAKALADVVQMSKRRLFNCQPVRLTTGDLDQLEMHVKNGTLPSTEGFFFGDDSDDYYKANDLEFIRRARLAINAGLEVYYSSWW